MCHANEVTNVLLILGLKETADLALLEVRKGFSHVHRRVETTGKHAYACACSVMHTSHHLVILMCTGENYEPLRSFSLSLKDKAGEQRAYHLKASSALICQL